MAIIENTDPLLADLDYANKPLEIQAQIDALIQVASELIEKYCNRIFLADDYVEEKRDGNGENVIFVRNPPINSISEITIRGYESEDLDFDDDIFDYDSRTGMVAWNDLIELTALDTTNFIGYFPRGFNNVLISYNGGYLEVPGPIKLACADLVRVSFSPELGRGNIEFEKLGQYFYKLSKDRVSENLIGHRKLLRLYQIHRV